MKHAPSDDDDNVIPLPPHGRMPAGETSAMLPCSRCSTLTPRGILVHYGARCLSCYRAYCQEPQPQPRPPQPARRRHGALFPPSTEPEEQS